MAENKKGFILYSDYLELFTELDDITAGQLIKHILRYVNDENPEPVNNIVKLSFIPIKQSLKRDLEKWEDKKRVRSEAGRLGGLARAANAKQNQANVEFAKQNQANQAVSVNGNVNVNDIINRFKDLDLEILFMQLSISPELINKYRAEFITKLTIEPKETYKEAYRWFCNWVKLQPKLNLNYLTEQERQNKGLNPKREYIHSKVDGSDYAGLLTDKEKEASGLDINRVYTIQNNLVV